MLGCMRIVRTHTTMVSPAASPGGAIHKEQQMGIGMILLILLILAMMGAVPAWPHSRQWGYYPSGGIGTVLLIVVILLLLGKI